MPYTVAENGPDDKPFCVFKVGEDDKPTGETLGCHATADEAGAQIGAIEESETKAAKLGARHSAKDKQLIRGIRERAREIDQSAQSLGDADPQEGAPPPGKATLPLSADAPRIWGTVKAAGAWELDVLGIPFGGPDSKDSDGQWFDSSTALHADKWPLPPVAYYHGFGPDRKPLGTPEYIGKAVRRWTDAAGVWFRVVLDKTSILAKRVWDGAQKGIARASSGSISHLIRIEGSGHIREWPVAELSVFDAEGERQPANRYAVAVPAAKALWERAGIEFTLPEVAPEAGTPAASTAGEDTTKTGDREMDEKEMTQLFDERLAAALKARDEREAAATKAAADEKVKIDAAVKAERERLEAEYAKANRLPGGGAPYVRRFPEAAKFDGLSHGEHALLVSVLASQRGDPQSAFKSLVLRCEADAAKHEIAREFDAAVKGSGMKANELAYTTQSGYGSQWVTSAYSRQLWESIRQDCWVLGKLQAGAVQIPDGYSASVFPLESTDPTWYKVAEATAETSGKPDVTVTSSKIATPTNKTISVVKMGCAVAYSGEMAEDALIPWAPNAMRQIKLSGQEQFEHAIIDGDTDAAITTNINDIAATPAGTEVFLLVDGFRKLPIMTTTSNARSGGVLDEDDFLDTMMLLGTAGINAALDKCSFILDKPTYNKALKLANLKTKDVWSQATLEKGQLTGIWGYPVNWSPFMHYMSAARKANTAGKVDQDVTTNNVTGSILGVRWDQWRLAWKRAMTIETTRYARSDSYEIVALVRWGLGYMDGEASAITYGITGV